MEYFDTGMVYKYFNYTVVILILKHDAVKKIKDFRPVVGCIIVLKIISEILTNRLRKVLPRIISPFQETFVSTQHIHNHIILAYELLYGYGRK